MTAQAQSNENTVPPVGRTDSTDGKSRSERQLRWWEEEILLIGREDSADGKSIFQWLKEHTLSRLSQIWRNINHFNVQAVLSYRSSIEVLRLKWSSFSPHFTQNAFLSPFSPYVTYLRTWKCVPLPSNRCRNIENHHHVVGYGSTGKWDISYYHSTSIIKIRTFVAKCVLL